MVHSNEVGFLGPFDIEGDCVGKPPGKADTRHTTRAERDLPRRKKKEKEELGSRNKTDSWWPGIIELVTTLPLSLPTFVRRIEILKIASSLQLDLQKKNDKTGNHDSLFFLNNIINK